MKTTFLLIISLLSYNSLFAQKPYDTTMSNLIQKKDSALVIKYFLDEIKRFGPDTAGEAKISGNNIAFNYIYTYSKTSKKQLKKGIKFMELFVKTPPSDDLSKNVWGGFTDTYAALLWRYGKKREAIEWQKRAIDLYPENPEIKDNLKKMQRSMK